MKKIQLLNLLFLASLVFSLAACKTSSDVMSSNWIQKRKYTKGFYVSKKAKTENDHAQAETEKEFQLEESTPAAVSAPAAKNTSKPLAKVESATQEHNSSAQIATPKPTKAKQAIEPVLNEMITALSIEKELSNQSLEEITEFVNQQTQSNPNDDAELVLMILLALIVAPIAVYIMYDISTEFWISLILYLLFVLPGAIYALYLVFQNY